MGNKRIIAVHNFGYRCHLVVTEGFTEEDTMKLRESIQNQFPKNFFGFFNNEV